MEITGPWALESLTSDFEVGLRGGYRECFPENNEDWKRHKKECKKLKEMQLGSNSSFESTSIISQSSRTVASSEKPVEISVIDSNDEVIEEISKESSMSL